MADKGQITGQQVLSDDVFTRLEKFDAALAGIPSRYTAIEESAKKATSNSGFEAAVKKSNDLNNETNVLLKEQKKLEDNLIRTKAKNKLLTESTARALAKQRFETQQQNRENKRAAILTSSTAGAYKKLSTELNNAKDKLKDLIVTQGEFSTAATKQRTEVDKLSAKIKKADNVAGDFQRNVGNYPSALRPVVGVLKGLVGAFGIVEGLRIGSRIVKETIALAREAKGVEFAFDRIGESGINAFDGIRKSTRGLISELDIKKAIVDFDNFNISLEESSVLFEFLALRSAQTGKSIDSLRDSLVEGLSKESKLRIDNLGISVVELNEELEKTPNFVKAVGVIAKREVSQAGNILDEAANGGEKFNASMENLKLSLGQIFSQIKGFSAVTDVLGVVGNQFKQINFAISSELPLLEKLAAITRTTTLQGQLYNEKLIAEAAARKEVTKQIEAQINAYVRLKGEIGPSGKNQDDGYNPFKFYENGPRLLADINKELEEQNKLLDEGGFSTRNEAKAIQDKIEKLQAEKDAILGVVESQNKANKQRKEFIESFELNSEKTITETIKYLENLKSEAEIGSKAYNDYTKQIKDFKKALDDLKGGSYSGVLNDLPFIEEGDENLAFEVDNFLNTEGVDNGLKDLAKRLGRTYEELVTEFESLYEKDFKNFLKYSELKIEQEQILAEAREDTLLNGLDVAQEFAQAYFDIQSNRVEDEIEKQNEAFDSLVNNKKASDEQIEIAEKKKDENEKKLEKEKQKRQRRAFIVQQAIEVAKVWIMDATARASALAPPPIGLGPVFGASLIPLISTNTGLALASILAQAIPQFFRGKNLMDNYEGPATVNELPGQREVRVSKDGRVELFSPGMQMTNVKRDDIITPSIRYFKNEASNPNSEVFKRIASRRIMSDTRERQYVVINNDSKLETKGIERTMEKVMNKYSKRPVFANVTLNDERRVRRY